MVIHCKIDVREKKIIDLIFTIFSKKYEDKFKNDIILETCALDLGDIAICNEHGEYLQLIERKTLNDLLASIKDGRYKNQSNRLESIDLINKNIVYLIEGNVMFPNITSSQRDQVLSSCFSLSHTKGFSLFKSVNIQETCEFILRSCYKFLTIEKGKEETNNKINEKDVIDFSNSNTICITQDATSLINTNKNIENNTHEIISNTCTLLDIQKMKKNKFINSSNIHLLMLCQIPGVSEKTANIILEQFSDIYTFITFIKENKIDFSKKNIQWLCKNTGKTIKIRKNVSDILLDYF